MAAPGPPSPPARVLEGIGRATLRSVSALGDGALLLLDALSWLALGRGRGQAVRASAVFSEMMQIGVRALPDGPPSAEVDEQSARCLDTVHEPLTG